MIFLTGGTGMLGAHLLLDLTRAGEKVRALRRKDSDLEGVKKIFSWYTPEADRLFRLIEWVEGDLLDKISLQEGMEGANAVIHAAAKVSFDPRDKASMLYENREGTRFLVDLALDHKIERFCFVSSISALGDGDTGLPVNEHFSWKNDRKRSTYSESKFQSEMEVWRGVQEGLSCVILNPSILLGPGNWESGSPRFFKTVQEGLKFYPPGGTGFVDVRDVCKAILLIMKSDEWETIENNRYVVSAENLSYREIFDMIASELEKPGPVLRANRFLLQTGWRVSRAISFLSGRKPALTKDTANSSARTTTYDGSRITNILPFQYTPIRESIRHTGKIFRDDHR
jgi:nucleoside-diphosphate-sugar epimerase